MVPRTGSGAEEARSGHAHFTENAPANGDEHGGVAVARTQQAMRSQRK